jgi:toxin ParE1/3/4
MKLRLLPRAVNDIAGQYDFIAKDNPAAALRVVERIEKSLRLIESNPLIGHPTPGRPVREWSVPGLPYVIPYRIRGETAEVLRVFHTRRRRPETWE